MNKKIILVGAALTISVAANVAQAADFELSGYVGAEWREHFEKGQFDNGDVKQADRQFGLTVEPEMVWSLGDGEHTLVFKPYARIDSEDDERSHGDIRELSWMTYGDDWEITAGLSKVYWGVAESQHLVDIINQTDFVEAPDGEDKLGQPMIKLTFIRDWGTVDSFILPGFRERTFPGEEGRFRTALPMDTDNAQYQAGEEDAHVDYAVRWSHTLEDYDLGLSWFNGTSRDPLFTPSAFVQVGPAPTDLAPTKLAPFYAQINQLGFDLQATIDSWLWKFEAIYRTYDDSVKNDFDQMGQSLEDYSATTGGIEYTFYGPFETVWDWGVLAEHQYDSRENGAIALGQNDAFLGSRIAFNDTASSEILMGISQDLDSSGTQSFILELATRVNEGVKLNVDIFLPMSDDDENVSYQFKRDDYIQLSLNYYY
ncbi:MAG: hypothetical protein V7765_03570 [Oleispira sp.]